MVLNTSIYLVSTQLERIQRGKLLKILNVRRRRLATTRKGDTSWGNYIIVYVIVQSICLYAISSRLLFCKPAPRHTSV